MFINISSCPTTSLQMNTFDNNEMGEGLEVGEGGGIGSDRCQFLVCFWLEDGG